MYVYIFLLNIINYFENAFNVEFWSFLCDWADIKVVKEQGKYIYNIYII